MSGIARVGMLLPMTFQPHGTPHLAPPPPDLVRIPPLPYHRQALVGGRHAWWRPLAGTLLVMVGSIVLMAVLIIGSEVAGSVVDRPLAEDDMRTWGDIGDVAVDLLSIAVMLPPVLLAARWVQGRPGGTVSSVTGRLRWRWLGLCALVALPLIGATRGLSFLLPAPDGGGEDVWVELPTFLSGLLVAGAIVPFQAAAEEYVFRGWLVQAMGAWVRSPWIAVLPQAVLFGAAHGWGTVWGFVDLVVFGVVTGLLAIRTGGIEAGTALHVLNNLLALGIAAALEGGLASDETAADMDWLSAAIDIPMVLLFGFVVLWAARRRGVATESEARESVSAYGYGYGHAPHVPGAWGGAFGPGGYGPGFPGPGGHGPGIHGAGPYGPAPHSQATQGSAVQGSATPGAPVYGSAIDGSAPDGARPYAPPREAAAPGSAARSGTEDLSPYRGWAPPSGRAPGGSEAGTGTGAADGS